MSSCSVYVLVMLFVTASALTRSEDPAAACARFFTKSLAYLCENMAEMGYYPGTTAENEKSPWVARVNRGDSLAELAIVCCNLPCTMNEILHYC